MEKEMKKYENMTEEELSSKAIEIEANQFRFCICKIFIILITLYLMACLIYQTIDPAIVHQNFSKELNFYMPKIFPNKTLSDSNGATLPFEEPTDL